MNNIFKKYRTIGNGLNLALLVSVLTPLIALAFYNHPSAADDYGYIDTVFKFGWLEAMHYYYTGWTGRYFGIFLNHTNPLLFHSITGFKILPILLLLGLVGSLYLLVRQLTPTLSSRAHLGFAGILFFLYVLRLTSIAEAFYWMASFVTYTLPSTLTFCWIVVVLRWYRLETPLMKILTGIFAGFLIFAVIGSSETNLLTILILLAGFLGFRLIFQREIDRLMIGLLVAAAIGCYFYFTAPGLSVRLGGNPLGGNIPYSIYHAFRKLAQLSAGWFFSTPLLIFTVVWCIVLSRMIPQARRYFEVPFWYVLILYIGLLSAQLFTSYYGIGIDPTAREINCVYLFFLVGWFYTSGVLYHSLSQRFSIPFLPRIAHGAIVGLLGIWTVFVMYNNANIQMIYRDWLRGKAAAYNAELYQRYELIKNSRQAVVYLPAIQNKPQSLFVDDIREDKNHWWNKLMAGYYGKEAIYMIPNKTNTNEPKP